MVYLSELTWEEREQDSVLAYSSACKIERQLEHTPSIRTLVAHMDHITN